MSIYHDSELMQQVVTSAPLTDIDDFYVARDEHSDPMLFSVGSDGILYVTKRDELGRNQLINLSDKFKIPSQDKVTALGVYQRDDSSLRIAFAHGDAHGASTLLVLRPIKPEDVLLSADAMGNLVLTGEAIMQHVYGLLMVGEPSCIDRSDLRTDIPQAKGADNDRPLVVAKLRNIEGDQDEICRVDVDDASSSWSVKHDLEMPCNPRSIISLSPGTLPGGGPPGKFGLFVLYQSGESDRCIAFTGLGGTSGFYTHVQYNCAVPPGAIDITTVTNQNHRSDLLIAARDGIYRLPASTCVRGSTELPTNSLVARSDEVQDLKQIAVAQDGLSVSVWTQNETGDLIYVQFEYDKTTGAFYQRSKAEPVLRGGLRFAPMFVGSSTSQRLFVLGDENNGKMRELFQAGDSKIWTSTSFAVPAIENPQEVLTYTTHIRIRGSNGRPFDGLVDLSASCHCVATVNGRSLHLSRAITQVKPDVLGTLTIIQEVDDLNVPSLKVVTAINSEPVFIDPGRKVLQFFEGIKSADDLKRAQLPNGEKLIDGDLPPDTDLEGAAKALSALTSRAASFSPGSQFQGVEASIAVKPSSKEDKMATVDTRPITALQTASWASFDWMSSAGKAVLEVLDQGLTFVITVGKKVLKFVVNTFQHVMKGIKVLFKAIGAGFKKLWEGLEFLFNWDDILDTHNIYRDCIEGFLDVAVAGVIVLGKGIDDFLDGIQHSIREKFDDLEKLPDEAGKPVGEESAEVETEEGKKLDQAINSPGGNSLTYQTQHNPDVKQSVDSAAGCIPDDDPLSTIWLALKSLLDEFWKSGKDIAGSFIELFSPSRKRTIGEIVSKLGGKLLVSLINAVRILIKAVLDVGASIIKSIKELLTAEMRIPVISWFWGKISDKPLSILDAFCLIMAVPGTIAFKAMTGEAPRKHSSYQGIKDSRKKLDESLLPILQPKLQTQAQAMLLPTHFDSHIIQPSPSINEAALMNTFMVPQQPAHEQSSASAFAVPLMDTVVTSIDDTKSQASDQSATTSNGFSTKSLAKRPNSPPLDIQQTVKLRKVEGFWDSLKDSILGTKWVRALLEWVEANAIWFGIGFGVFNTIILAKEVSTFKPEGFSEFLSNGEKNPNFKDYAGGPRWPVGLQWSKWSVGVFIFGACLSLPRNTKLPSWPLRMVDWMFSWLGIFKHAVNQRLRGILGFLLGSVQTLTYTASWIWDRAAGYDTPESFPVILNTYLAKAHDILYGVAMTLGGTVLYVNVACSTCGIAGTLIGVGIITTTVEQSTHFVLRSI